MCPVPPHPRRRARTCAGRRRGRGRPGSPECAPDGRSSASTWPRRRASSPGRLLGRRGRLRRPGPRLARSPTVAPRIGRHDAGRTPPRLARPPGDAWTSLARPRRLRGRASSGCAQHVRAGDVYQANICRVLSAPLAGETRARRTRARRPGAARAARLARGNPAPYAGVVHVPAASGLPPAWVVTASPELYLRLDRRRPDVRAHQGHRRAPRTASPPRTAPRTS